MPQSGDSTQIPIRPESDISSVRPTRILPRCIPTRLGQLPSFARNCLVTFCSSMWSPTRRVQPLCRLACRAATPRAPHAIFLPGRYDVASTVFRPAEAVPAFQRRLANKRRFITFHHSSRFSCRPLPVAILRPLRRPSYTHSHTIFTIHIPLISLIISYGEIRKALHCRGTVLAT